MSQPFVGQLMYTGFNFPPKGWAMCNGQLLSLSQNTALFSLLGTFYGGDGRTTFALPDMRGRAPIHVGQGNGLSDYFIGQVGGSETHTMISTEVPLHNHTMQASTSKAETAAPANNSSMLGRSIALTQAPHVYIPSTSSTGTVQVNVNSVQPNTPSGVPFNITQPVLTMNCNVALAGVYPPRS